MKVEVYVISLPEHHGRREKLRESFPEFYRDFRFVEAVMGPKLSASEYFDLILGCYLDELYLMDPASVGCSLSHIRVWERFLSSDADAAIVFEDDVIGSDEGLRLVKSMLPRIWEVYGDNFVWYLGGMDGLVKDYIRLRSSKVGPGVFEVPYFSRRYVLRTSSYLVTRSSSEAMLARQKSRLSVADDWHIIVPRETKFLFSEIFGHPIVVRPEESSIGDYRKKTSLYRGNKKRLVLIFRFLNLALEGLLCRILSNLGFIFGLIKPGVRPKVDGLS